jgi:DNA-binding MarR family transcriptional regulator
MIDRLEKAGYVQRERDKTDRRKVFVVPNKTKIDSEIAPFSRSMGVALDTLSKEFSEAELEIILRFLTKANSAGNGNLGKLRKKLKLKLTPGGC